MSTQTYTSTNETIFVLIEQAAGTTVVNVQASVLGTLVTSIGIADNVDVALQQALLELVPSNGKLKGLTFTQYIDRAELELFGLDLN